MLTIVNCHYETCDFYCGRAYNKNGKVFKASPLANYHYGIDAIDRFGCWLWERIQVRDPSIMKALWQIFNEDWDLQVEAEINGWHEPVPYRLGCWCSSERKPRPCHCLEIIGALEYPPALEILNAYHRPFEGLGKNDKRSNISQKT